MKSISVSLVFFLNLFTLHDQLTFFPLFFTGTLLHSIHLPKTFWDAKMLSVSMRFIAVATADGNLSVWSYETRKMIIARTLPEGQIFGVCFCPHTTVPAQNTATTTASAPTLLVATANSFLELNVETLAVLRRHDALQRLLPIAFDMDPDGNVLYVDVDGALRVQTLCTSMQAPHTSLSLALSAASSSSSCSSPHSPSSTAPSSPHSNTTFPPPPPTSVSSSVEKKDNLYVQLPSSIISTLRRVRVRPDGAVFLICTNGVYQMGPKE